MTQILYDKEALICEKLKLMNAHAPGPNRAERRSMGIYSKIDPDKKLKPLRLR